MTRYYRNFIYSCRRFPSLNYILRINTALLIFSAFAIISCEEDPTKIGQGLLPSNDFVEIASTDTLSVWSFTTYDPKVRTDLPTVSYLGELHHPYYGTTTAEFVTELRLGNLWDETKAYTVDSVKLVLRVLDARGSYNTPRRLKLSEIDKRLYVDSAYYSNTPVPVTWYSVEVETPALDSTVTDLVADLPVDFGNYLIRDTSMLFHSATKDDFRSFFNGLYFQMEPGQDPGLLALSLSPPSSLGNNQNYIVLFMHDQFGTYKEFYFILDATNRNASFNKFTHDLSTADPNLKVQHVNDGYRDTVTFLQYLNGMATTLVFPGLEALKNNDQFKNIVVNRAELTLPIYFDDESFKPSTIPSQLVLRYTGKDGSKYIVPEYYYDQYQSFFGGQRDTIKDIYMFNVPGYLQEYFDDATGVIKPELEVYQQSGLRNAAFKTSKSSIPVKLKFTYTRF
jgi:hypothetical protein